MPPPYSSSLFFFLLHFALYISRVRNGEFPELKIYLKKAEPLVDNCKAIFDDIVKAVLSAHKRNPNVRCILYFTSPEHSASVAHPDLLALSDDACFRKLLEDFVSKLPKSHGRKNRQIGKLVSVCVEADMVKVDRQ